MNKSLKTKILSILIGLLVITVAFNLAYSYRLFINDKKSYIFEADLRQSENLNDQLNFKIKEFSSLTRLHESVQVDPVSFQKIIGKNEEILAIGQVDQNGKVLTLLKNNYLLQRKKSAGTMSFEINEGSEFLSPTKYKINQLDMVALNPSTKGYIYFFKINPEKYNFFFTTTETFDNIFKSNSLFSNLYLNLNQDNPIHAQLIAEIKAFPGEKGTLEFVAKDEELLVSFVKSSTSGRAVVSFIPKDKAFQITSSLIIQAVLFGLFLLGILITIGVYFSNTITTPILELTKLSGEFSRGEFGRKFLSKTNDEISVLGNTFNNMSMEIESLLEVKEEMIKTKALIIKDLGDAKDKLEDYSQNLEKKIKIRTMEIKKANVFMGAMVNSLDQGLMVFDKNLKCLDIYTTVCEKLFNLVPKGKAFYDIIGLKNSNEIENVKTWSNIIFSAATPFEHMTPLGPKAVVSGNNYYDENFKHIALSYRPMKDGHDNIENIVVLATDITKEIRSTEISKEKEAYTNMIVKILNNKAQFQLFVNYVKTVFIELTDCYNEAEQKLNYEQAMKLFHTLNGGFGLYHLIELQDLARKNEFSVSEFKLKKENLRKYPDNVTYFKKKFKANIERIDELLQTSFFAGDISREIESSKIYALKALIDKNDDMTLRKEFYAYLVHEPIKKYFSQFNDLVISLAKESAKNISPIVIKNGDLKIDPEPYMEFFNILVHVFKNCIEHGIESDFVREKAGKPKEGHIEVDCSIKTIKDASYLCIAIQDDGAGIDIKRIAERLTKIYPDKNFSTLRPEELVQKIFEPNFSTKDKVGLHSGRGVGMSAVKDIVDNLKGTILIESKPGKRTKFIFTLPMASSSLTGG